MQDIAPHKGVSKITKLQLASQLAETDKNPRVSSLLEFSKSERLKQNWAELGQVIFEAEIAANYVEWLEQ